MRGEYLAHRDDDLYDFVLPLRHTYDPMPGSTDVGDVSWICPTVQAWVTAFASKTPGHSWQLVAQGRSSMAHKGMMYAAKVMAATAIDLVTHPDIIEKARQEHSERLDHKRYVSPIPQGVRPEALVKE